MVKFKNKSFDHIVNLTCCDTVVYQNRILVNVNPTSRQYYLCLNRMHEKLGLGLWQLNVRQNNTELCQIYLVDCTCTYTNMCFIISDRDVTWIHTIQMFCLINIKLKTMYMPISDNLMLHIYVSLRCE
jgi:hypothetical protein